MNDKPMKFLLLPKEGKPRFSSKDPWKYIRSRGLKIINDYFNENSWVDPEFKENIYFNQLPDFEGTETSIIFINKLGEKQKSEKLNPVANSLCHAFYFNGDYKIYDEAILLKNSTTFDNVVDFNIQDIKNIRRALKDAVKWF